ncbi:DNA methyltransferase [Gulosibacter bifidus]|uniref:DNA methyltransferase n=1 Tax=Gulosibacter bifidus TaxID=272239 RepID=A0ABW5RH15_9MICO|nr:site-specific DNA-methyltransferase [Gulosibacter bifidus]
MNASALLTELPALLERARIQTEAEIARARAAAASLIIPVSASGCIARGDNLQLLAQLVVAVENGAQPAAKLVYLDPPYASDANYRSRIHTQLADGAPVALEHIAYSDRWQRGVIDYLEMLAPRLMLAQRVLRDDGAICAHVDWHAAHLVRVLLDEIFGADNFVNSLVWSYRSGGASRTTSVPRKHDDLLVYRRSSAFRVNGQRERQYLDKPFMGSKRDPLGRFYVDTILRDVLEGEITLVDETAAPGDPAATTTTLSVRPVLNLSSERTGYATQKPEGLLTLLLRWFTAPSDLVVDPFAGSGTLAVMAEQLQRKWCTMDASRQAVVVQRQRLDACASDYAFIECDDIECADASIATKLAAPSINYRTATPGDGTRVHITLERAAAHPALADGIHPARGENVDAVTRVLQDPLAHVAGWMLWAGESRVCATWRDARGALTNTVDLAVDAAADTVEIVDLLGHRQRWALPAREDAAT